MLPDTHPILVAFVDILKNKNIPPAYFDYYKKWLRYFLDFCEIHPQIQDQEDQTVSGKTAQQTAIASILSSGCTCRVALLRNA